MKTKADLDDVKKLLGEKKDVPDDLTRMLEELKEGLDSLREGKDKVRRTINQKCLFLCRENINLVYPELEIAATVYLYIFQLRVNNLKSCLTDLSQLILFWSSLLRAKPNYQK